MSIQKKKFCYSFCKTITIILWNVIGLTKKSIVYSCAFFNLILFRFFFYRMKFAIQLWAGLFVFQCIVIASLASDPKFDPTTRMRLVLVPADAAVGSVIYRLRASDDEFDYPLTFELVGE